MRWGVIVFPGSCDDQDVYDCLKHVLGQKVEFVWHRDNLQADFDCLVLPGGFSYGDYLRAGAVARFSPIMRGVVEYASRGGLVVGICNGFQILCEAGLLPGVLTRNASLQFVCRHVYLRLEETDTPFTCAGKKGQVLKLPVKHGEGCYYADPTTLERLRQNRQILFRYVDAKGRTSAAANPNGSLDDIAGVCNEGRNVFGMMPHPEDATEKILGSDDGLKIFSSIAAAGKEREKGARVG
ncbi:MAG: phosphoribosylformylglycinamidine synthase I [Deltaproteobacteria bacterium GWA2_57_13]|nr:MAG: phosphoribosylformylglycinamidine synthase I [Deltaproteobacteria bacterium GWA2_57_13]OGQ51220.1 MAG: phosphoribosylformylglycinamidine synthase I [Deltaproteobacteria bacterium RIFCSPLOWO2_02_FULL_57_26]OGQ84649.1 MAG: phosphoribosylformylglycinamidine synthase I [Deltaproteobacteria bacterium RIFCSPLOWO2_12_FULL_57_22]